MTLLIDLAALKQSLCPASLFMKVDFPWPMVPNVITVGFSGSAISVSGTAGWPHGVG